MARLHLAAFVIAAAVSAVACDDDDDAIPCQHDADCPEGLECEFEHGKAFCKPHGGDDDTDATDTDPPVDTTGGDACKADADCPDGMECEIEHGEGFCKPHGGDDDSNDDSNSGGSN